MEPIIRVVKLEMEKSNIKNIVKNSFSVISLILTIFVVTYWLLPSLFGDNVWSSFILLVHFFALLVLIMIGPYSQKVLDTFKSFGTPFIQFLIAVVIGSMATIFAVDTVASVLPGDPYIYKNALLIGIAINYLLLMIIMAYHLLLIFYMFVGYKIFVSDIKRETSQSNFYRAALFLGLLVGLSFSYKVFLKEAIGTANTYGDDLIIFAQFHKNYSCTSVPLDKQITFVNERQILVFNDDKSGKGRFDKVDCDS